MADFPLTRCDLIPELPEKVTADFIYGTVFNCAIYRNMSPNI